ncbi:hypothetical protein [uncultured Eubacterium sp.]|uniref:hypothetical protein n=1 Tax=uncultured Eubacterium sp. TaxID=165185 RepID=UPI0025DF0792|nr:hypothetical protein [uncultured Eubacterium sp.]
MSLENSVEFLIFTYFGVCFKDNFDTILKSAIKVAYNDATMQGAYNALEKENAEEIDYDKVAQELENTIKELLKENSNGYEKWHKATCKELVKHYEKVSLKDKSPAFSYGNAQKWVNMTMKYLYILSEIFLEYKNDCVDCKKYKKIQGLYKYFQVPVDSFIIESVWNNENVTLPLVKENLLKNGTRGVYSSEKVTPWSKWDDTEYKEFQEHLPKIFKDHQTPLDWEHKAWIEIAKKRREK